VPALQGAIGGAGGVEGQLALRIGEAWSRSDFLEPTCARAFLPASQA